MRSPHWRALRAAENVLIVNGAQRAGRCDFIGKLFLSSRASKVGQADLELTDLSSARCSAFDCYEPRYHDELPYRLGAIVARRDFPAEAPNKPKFGYPSRSSRNPTGRTLNQGGTRSGCSISPTRSGHPSD